MIETSFRRLSISDCIHVDGQVQIVGESLTYRAHIRLLVDEGGITEQIESVHIDYDHSVVGPSVHAALQHLTQESERTLNEECAEEALARYMMKRVRGEPMDDMEPLN